MPRKIVTNPFGDDSDESDDGFNNPFAAKRSNPLPTTTPSTNANANANASTANKSSNPFNDDELDIPQPLVTKTSANLKNKSNNNPFNASPSPPSNASKPPPSLNPNMNDTKASNSNINSNSSNKFTAFEKTTNPFGDTLEDVFQASDIASARQHHTKSHKRNHTVGPGIDPAVDFADFEQDSNNNRTPIKSRKGIFARRTKPLQEPMALAVDQDAEMSPPKKNMPNGDGGDGGVRFDASIPFGEKASRPGFLGGHSRSKSDGSPLKASSGAGAENVSGTSMSTPKKKIAGGGGVQFDTSSPSGEKKMSRPGFLGTHSRSKSDGAALKETGNGTDLGGEKDGTRGGWLRGGIKVADEHTNTPKKKNTKAKTMFKGSATGSATESNNAATRVSRKKEKKNVFVQCWPYDDYHKDQEKYYETLAERDVRIGTPRRKKGANEFGYNSGSDDDELEMGIGINGTDEDAFARDSIFERPSDLPGISEAVQNLSLFDFENKAGERAISIVSTWLFDAGLIDELLVNGARGYGHRMPISSSSSIAAQSTSIESVKSSEGVEVGAHGFPLEGGLKIDKESEKLRAGTQRELTLINTRLNDGVAASGSEVQELVNAVSATKSELGRLRELATYISSGYKKDGGIATTDSKDGLLLADYPRLKRAINARRNIFRCFRELEFFSQIPLTCDRLREELHQGEWTDNEWNTIRNVCMEHVELEILLVEAEAGMKAWLDDEEGGDDDSSMPSIRSNKSLKRTWKGRQQAAILAGNHQVVDNFLSQHVKNVWELGEEIRMRILSGVGSAFDLALQNPAGMVALVEAVEVYERAAEQYKASRGYGDDDSGNGDKNLLHFTDMRAAALAQLYQDFELRGLEVFRAIHMQAADIAEEDDALSSQFNAVLRAATELVTEIDVVKNQMAPCFASHWHVEMLWSSCVAHVCSNQIIQQIGGPDGQHLPELNVTQLLDLVAWVEFYNETIEDAFPSIGSINAKKTYFDERPDLFAGNEKVVNMENAKDSLAWVNNMLWDVHRMAQDEFLLRTRSQTDAWITKVYSTHHETDQTREGRLITSLCEDIFSLAKVQLRTIRERLTKKSDALVMAVCLIFSQLRSKQLTSRDKFLRDLETCCASANDFQRMSEEVEDVVQDLIDHSELPESSIQMLEDSCGALVSLYSGDAVFAAQRAHCFIFEPIEEAIGKDLFGPKWENELTHNELAMTLTRTLVRTGKNCV